MCSCLRSVQKQDSVHSFLLWYKMQSALVLDDRACSSCARLATNSCLHAIGRPATMKKKGSVKPKKKETAAAIKKGGKGTKGATPADSHTPPPEEVVAEGGMPTADGRVPIAQGGLHTGEGRMEAPAASSAGQVAPAKGHPPVEGPSTDRAVPTSAESQQGKAHFTQGDSQQAGLDS